MRQRLVVGGERFIRRQRDACLHHTRRRQRRIVLGNGDVVGEIKLGGAGQRIVGTGEIDIARAARRHLRFIHGSKRRAYQEQETVARGLEEDVELHIVGNLVCGGVRH